MLRNSLFQGQWYQWQKKRRGGQLRRVSPEHVVFFLHLDTRSEGGWTLIAFIFTAVIVVIAIAGSIWIMYHLNATMMPMPPGAAQGM